MADLAKLILAFTTVLTHLDPINSKVPSIFWIGGIPARVSL